MNFQGMEMQLSEANDRMKQLQTENAELRRQLESSKLEAIEGFHAMVVAHNEAIFDLADLRERLQKAEVDSVELREATTDLHARLQKAEANSRRLDWLVKELNDLHSNVTRDVFGLVGDEEGDLTIEFIDAAIAASEKEHKD